MRRGRVPELGLLLLGYQILNNIGLTNIPPVTLLSIVSQVGVYLQFVVVPRLCISGKSVWQDRDYARLVVPAFRHTHDIHLYYNMVSLAWKGLEMERRLGSVKYLVTLLLLTVMSSCFYVVLALVGSDVLEDSTIMSQCAIGFSGVLFAMKVVNIHQANMEQERTSFFGFLVPLKYAAWLELVIIQVVVPNSSFMGHLGGILAGLMFVKTPLCRVLCLQPAGGELRGRRRGESRLSSLLPAAPLSLVLCGLQICLHFGLVPRLQPLTGCVRTTFDLLDMNNLSRLVTSPLHHLSFIHLAVSLVSLQVKGRTLEPRLGGVRFLVTCLVSVLATSLTRLCLTRLVSEPPPSCLSGLSAPLFCLKVISLRHTSLSHTSTIIFELAELLMLLEPNTRTYHVSGLVSGVFLLVFWSDLTGDRTFSGRGQRLGAGGAEGGQPAWTRSWGYAGYEERREEEELQEALRRSRWSQEQEAQEAHGFTPTAPPMEEEEGELVPDLVGVRPPLYAQEVAPPPPGQAYRISQTEDEVRRRRLERFS